MRIYTLTDKQANTLPEHPEQALWPTRVEIGGGGVFAEYACGSITYAQSLRQVDRWLTPEVLRAHYTRKDT